VKNAQIEFESDSRYRQIYKWSTRSDAVGGFVWDSSPNEPFTVSVWTYGFEQTNVTVHPGNDEQVITLVRLPDEEPVLVRGSVVDAGRHEPLKGAEVYLKETSTGEIPFHHVADVKEGGFSFKLDNRKPSYQIEVRMQGYEPARSAMFTLDEPLSQFVFALKKADEITGIIISPEGKPVANAEVALCSPEKGAILGKRKFLFIEQSEIVRTDANGRFVHKPEAEAHGIYSVHDTGYAEVRLKEWVNGGQLKLKPWARMEGTMMLGGQVATNKELWVNAAFWHGIEQTISLYDFTTRTDEQGRFAFDDLPPMEVRLSWLKSVGARVGAASHPVLVRLEPGKTTQMQYALEGATVTGKLVWNGEEQIDWISQVRGSLGPRLALRPWENTPGYREADAEGKKRIEYEFLFTEAGRDWMRQQRSPAVQIYRDGTFEIPYTAPGRYTLNLWCSEKSGPIAGLPGKVIARLQQEITIPDGAEKFDVGEVLVQATF
jgi:hypothetical protein